MSEQADDLEVEATVQPAGDAGVDPIENAAGGGFGPSPRQRRLRAALLLLAVVFAAIALAAQWDDVRDRIGDLSAGPMLAAAVLALASLAMAFVAWRETLAGLGDRVAWPSAARIYFLGQLAKYVPGSVWSIVGQMEQARAVGIRRDRSATAGVVVLVVSLTTAIGLGVLAVPALLDVDGAGYAAVVGLLPLLGIVLWPAVLNRLVGLGLRVLRRPPLDHDLTAGPLLRVAGAAAVSNALLGLVTWILAVDLGGEGWLLLPLCIGAYNIASAIAFVVIPLPAGAGLREAVLVLLLAPEIGSGRATLLAVLTRLVLTVTDVAVAAGVASLTRRAVPTPGAQRADRRVGAHGEQATRRTSPDRKN